MVSNLTSIVWWPTFSKIIPWFYLMVSRAAFGLASRATALAPSAAAHLRDSTREQAELRFTDLRWFEEVPRSGHFAALEQPESLVEQLRGFFGPFR